MYWRHVFSEAWKRAKSGLASRQRRLTSIGVPVVSFIIGITILRLLQQPIPLTLFVGIFSALLGYGLVVLWEWVRHVVHLLPETHAENLQTIDTLKTRVAELKQQLETPPPPAPDPIIVTVQQGHWGVPRIQTAQNVIEASFPIKIRNSGTQTTLDDWALRSRGRPNVACKLIGFSLGSPNAPSVTDVRITPLPQGGAAAGSIAFQITGISLTEAADPSLGWFLEFSDAAGGLHRADIPKEHYSRSAAPSRSHL